MPESVLETQKLRNHIAALELENKRLKEKMADMVTPVQVAKELPRRGTYLLGRMDGSLLCSGKRPLNITQVASAILEVEGSTTVTVYRLIPWRTVHVDRITPEFVKHQAAVKAEDTRIGRMLKATSGSAKITDICIDGEQNSG